MPDVKLMSVTLKINKTSVMLYGNRYVKLPDGKGASAQVYLASFSKNVTTIPDSFETALRQNTSGRPERYFALITRIESEVLEPARERQRQAREAAERAAIHATLGHLIRGLKDIPEMAGYPNFVKQAECQEMLIALRRTTKPLVQQIAVADQATVIPTDLSETRLQQLMQVINASCAEIASMMPESAGGFKRGHKFSQETVQQVQNLWFGTSGAIAALSGRSQLRRPKTWTANRLGHDS